MKPTLNLHKKQKRTSSLFLQPPTKKEIQGLTKLMRSQKTEVIQVQCANRGTGDTEKKQNRTQGPKRFQLLLLLLLSFLLPVDWGVGALRARNSVPFSAPGLGSPVQLSNPPHPPASYPDPWTGGPLLQEEHPHPSLR